VLRHAQGLQLGHHDALKNQLSIADVAISEINPKKDQELFIEHNLRAFGCPADWTFEPCASHYDTVREMGIFV
jgi:formin-binding protein 1